MPDLNDVVRHVILRIVVDQAGLSEQLAKAKTELKALKDSEKGINDDRAKSATNVTKAVREQNDALTANQRAHDAAERSRSGSGKSSVDAHRAATTAINDETKAVKGQIIEEAKAEQLRVKAYQDRLDRVAKRRRFNQDTRQQDAKFDAEQANREVRYFNDEKARILDLREQRKISAKQADEQLEQLKAKTEKLRAEADKVRVANQNTKLGGQTDRANKGNESQARIDERAKSAETARNTAKENAAKVTTERIEGMQAASGQKIYNDQVTAETKLADLKEANSKKQEKLDDDIAKAKAARDQRNEAAKNIDQSKVNTAALGEESAGYRAQSAAANTGIAQEREKVVKKYADPQEAVRLRNAEEQVNKVISQREVIEERLVKIRAANARDAEREALRLAKNNGGLRDERGLKGLAYTGASIYSSLRSNFEKPEGGSLTVPTSSVGVDSLKNAFRSLHEEIKKGSSDSNLASRFFAALKPGEKTINDVGRLRNAFNGLRRDLKELPSSGGGGGISSFFSNIGKNFSSVADNILDKTSGLGRHLLSFRGVILVVLSAFGPLVAILGAVGAGALGLASNIVSLSGVLFALPGIIGAAVSAFSVLHLVMKPLTDVFSAYTAAQKEATTATASGTSAAATALLNLQDAQLQVKQAQLASTRADQDAKRAVTDLADARKDAARKIQDYRLALQKLKFDEEGAALGVDSAEEDYRRSLADPTANNLDRRQARHAVEGALFDKRDQQVSEGRLKEDAAEAEAKGVEGSDQVVSAIRAQQDAAIALEASYIAVKKAAINLRKAQLEKDAGGTASAALQAELDKLGPKTRKVAEAFIDLQKSYKGVRERLSEKVFGPLSQDTGKFRDLLKSLEDFLGPTADSLGKLADQAIKLFTNPEWKAFFKSQGGANGRIIKELGDAALSAADGFRAVVEVARPFTDFVVGGLKGMADSFKDFATSKDGREQLAAFLDNTKKRIKELAPIVVDLFKGFAGFFKALTTPDSGGGEDFTTKVNKGLGGAAKSFRELGEQAANPNSGFRKWLRDISPLLKDTVKFIKQAAGFFGDLMKNPANIKEARNILKELGDKVLPALVGFFDKLSKSEAVSKIISGIGSALGGFNVFLDKGGTTALGAFASIIETIGTTIGYLAKHLGPVVSAFGVLATVFASLAGAALFTKLLGIVPALKGILGIKTIVQDVLKGNFLAPFDRLADKITGKEKGQTRAERDAATGTGAAVTANKGGVLPTLYRMEVTLTEILAAIRAGGFGDGSTSTGGGGKNGPTGGGGSTGPRGPQTGGGGPGSRLRNATTTSGIKGLPTVSTTLAESPRSDIRTGRVGSRLVNATGLGLSGLPIANTRATNALNSITPADVRGQVAEATTSARRVRTTSINDASPIPYNLTTSAAQRERDARRVDSAVDSDAKNSPAGIARRREAVQAAREARLNPTTRGNDLYRSERFFNQDQQRLANAVRPEAEEENRRRDAESARNNRPTSESRSASQKRADAAKDRYTRRNASLTASPERPSLPSLASDLDAPGQAITEQTSRRRRLTTTIADPLNPTASGTTGYGNLGQYGNTPDTPRRVRTTAVPSVTAASPQNAYDLASGSIDETLRRTNTAQPKRSRFSRVREYLGQASDGLNGNPQIEPRGDPYAEQRARVTAQNAGRGYTTPVSQIERSVRPKRSYGPYTRPTGFTSAFTNVVDAAIGGDDRGGSATITSRGTIPRILDQGERGGSATITSRGTIPRVLDDGDRGGSTSVTGRRSSSLSRFNPLRPFLSGDDSGFISADRTPRAETPRRARSAGRVRRGGRGIGGLFSAGASLLGGGLLGGGGLSGTTPIAGVGGEDEYDEGYDDGLAQARRGMAGGQGGLGIDPGQQGSGRRSRRGLPVEEEAAGRGRSAGRFGNLFRGAEEAAEGAGGRGLLSRGGGLLARGGGLLAKGLAGGLVGAALTGVASIGGEVLTDKYVKSGKDAGSINRGLGAVTSGAGIGATIGSIIPGVGTVVGGAVGGLVGGAYSLLKDKNLRDFVGGKIGSGAKAVGGFFSGIGKSVGGFFGGDDDKPAGGGAQVGGLGKAVAVATGPLGLLASKTDIGKSILGSLSKAGTGIADFFTKKIPDLFHKGVTGITDFFTKTLPALPGKAFDAIFLGIGRTIGFFTKTLPRAVGHFFTVDIPNAASAAFDFVRRDLFDPFVSFIRAIPGFFTETIPRWFESVGKWERKHIVAPIKKFVTETVPDFFTETIPKWFRAAPQFFRDNVVTPVADFFTVRVPEFFTKTLPDAIKSLPGFLYNNLVQPILDFFGGIAGHVGDFLKGGFEWAKGLFSRAGNDIKAGNESVKMSGGLIEGVYQGLEDTTRLRATPGEFVVRRSKVQQPRGAEFLRDYNEGRIDPSQFYAGLSASTAPQVMSIVPPGSVAALGAVPSVVNHTVNQGLAMGDITINNPVQEKSEHSLRRQIQLAAIRHRR